MSTKKKTTQDVVIIVPVYRSKLSPTEEFSLTQAMHILFGWEEYTSIW